MRTGLVVTGVILLILGISIVLWFLAAYPKAPDGATDQQQLAQSFAGRAGHVLEPAIKPNPSRNHCTTAPPMKTLPSNAYSRGPLAPSRQAIVVSS